MKSVREALLAFFSLANLTKPFNFARGFRLKKKQRSNRAHSKFQIGPNSHPRKVQRWLARGGGTVVHDVKPHVHPRSKRKSVNAPR